MVTEWLPIHPRNDVFSGMSYAFFDKGWKISKFYDANKELLYWYCDIVEVKIENDEYTFIDLLVDVKVYKDGSYEILDMDELDEVVRDGLIDENKKEEALRKLNELVELIKNGKFPLEECKN